MSRTEKDQNQLTYKKKNRKMDGIDSVRRTLSTFECVIFRLYTRGHYTLAKDYTVGHTIQPQGRTKLR